MIPVHWTVCTLWTLHLYAGGWLHPTYCMDSKLPEYHWKNCQWYKLHCEKERKPTPAAALGWVAWLLRTRIQQWRFETFCKAAIYGCLVIVMGSFSHRTKTLNIKDWQWAHKGGYGVYALTPDFVIQVTLKQMAHNSFCNVVQWTPLLVYREWLTRLLQE